MSDTLSKDPPRQPRTFVPAPADGVLPEGFFSTTNLPTYARLASGWRLPENPRMDSVLVWTPEGDKLGVLEGRFVRQGQLVAVGLKEDGSEGILVDCNALLGDGEEASGDAFTFMASEVSREKPADYSNIVEALIREKAAGGHIVWVLGPAVVHARSRRDIQWLVTNGFAGCLFAGNALAVHDIEAALYHTTLGMTDRGAGVPGGHAHHMRAINQIRAVGSIAAAVKSGLLQSGIMHDCVTHNVPWVLAGSIRDDGPLPDTIPDTLVAQERMREHAKKATCVVMVASALHGIATGNMLPAYYTRSGELHLRTTVCVDQTEFVVNKMKDRGTHQAGVKVTNADYHRLRRRI